MKLSFDFDGTLNQPWVQEIARKCIVLKYDVWIVTSRYDDAHSDVLVIPSLMSSVHPANDVVYGLAKELGIPERRIIFTNKQPKSQWLAHSGIKYHLDDDEIEIDDINANTETKALNIHEMRLNLHILAGRLFPYGSGFVIQKATRRRRRI